MNFVQIAAKSGRVELGDLDSLEVSFQHENVYPSTSSFSCIIRSGENVIFDGIFVDFLIYQNMLTSKKHPFKTDYLFYNLEPQRMQFSAYPSENNNNKTTIFCELLEVIANCSIEFRNVADALLSTPVNILSSLNDPTKKICDSRIFSAPVFDSISGDSFDVELESVFDFVAFPYYSSSMYGGMRMTYTSAGYSMYEYFSSVYADKYIPVCFHLLRRCDREIRYFEATLVLLGNFDKISIPIDKNNFVSKYAVVSFYKKKFK